MEKLLIAEYKPFSPHVGRISNETIEVFIDRMSRMNPWMISVITDERWGGSFQLLGRALNVSQWPVMAKGTNVHAEMAVKAGAEWALTYDLHEAQTDPHFRLYEINQNSEGEGMFETLDRILINNRDMETGEIDMDFAKAACEKVKDDSTFVIVGSGYKSIEDPNIPERANAVLIGTELQTIVPERPKRRRAPRPDREEREEMKLNDIFYTPDPDQPRQEERERPDGPY